MNLEGDGVSGEGVRVCVRVCARHPQQGARKAPCVAETLSRVSPKRSEGRAASGLDSEASPSPRGCPGPGKGTRPFARVPLCPVGSKHLTGGGGGAALGGLGRLFGFPDA